MARIDVLAGPAEPPSRIHGDCWSGNVLWSGGRGWLIDPAAHGGHRETDLAMLALFGAPHHEHIMRGYQAAVPLAAVPLAAVPLAAVPLAAVPLAAVPLAAGWPARVPLHQLHPLLVHVCLFGAGYRQPVLAAARAALAGLFDERNRVRGRRGRRTGRIGRIGRTAPVLQLLALVLSGRSLRQRQRDVERRALARG